MKITLRHLAVFDAVSSLGSVVQAAEQLHMSPSAVSAALRDFQLALDVPPLFHRVGRNLKITEEGRRLRPKVRSLIGEVEGLRVPADSQGHEGTIAVGVTDSGSYFLPPVALAFRELHPGVRIAVTVGQSQDIVQMLTNFALDFVITDSLARAQGLQLTELFRERQIFVAAPGHRLAGRKDLTFADLEQADWCLPSRNSLANTRLLELVRGHIANFRIAIEINSDEGVREAVKAGGGIGCLPLSLAESDLASGRLVELELPGFSARRPTYLMEMPSLRKVPAAKDFGQHLIDSFAARTA